MYNKYMMKKALDIDVALTVMLSVMKGVGRWKGFRDVEGKKEEVGGRPEHRKKKNTTVLTRNDEGFVRTLTTARKTNKPSLRTLH